MSLVCVSILDEIKQKQACTWSKLIEDRKAWFCLIFSSRSNSYSESCPYTPCVTQKIQHWHSRNIQILETFLSSKPIKHNVFILTDEFPASVFSASSLSCTCCLPSCLCRAVHYPPLFTLRMTLRRTTLVVTFSSSSDTPSTSPSSWSSWTCIWVSTERTEPLAMWRTFWQLMTKKARRMKLKRSSVTRAHIAPRRSPENQCSQAGQHTQWAFSDSCCLTPQPPEPRANSCSPLALVLLKVGCLSFTSCHFPLAGSVGSLPWSLFFLLPTLRSGVAT